MSSTISVDLKIYRLNAIKKAAYRLSAIGTFEIATANDEQVIVRITGLGKSNSDIRSLIERFHRELLDQELREEIAAETAPVRNLLLAQAFSATSLIDPFVDSAEYRTDPIGIAKPYKAE